MSQNASLPVLDLVGVAIPPDLCAYLTTLLHQTLADAVEPRSHAAQSSWHAQDKDVFLVQTVFIAMSAALDAYTDLVAAHLSVLGRGAAGHSPHGGYAKVPGDQSPGRAQAPSVSAATPRVWE